MRKPFIVAAILLFGVTGHAQTVDTVWGDLTAGNRRFVEGNLQYCALHQLRNATAGGQSPQTSILSCADSRVPAELVFDRSIGELFVVRVAGNVDQRFGVASLQYAVLNGWSKLLIVMGHSECGAVKESLTLPKPGQPTPELYELIVRIRKSFKTTPRDLREATIMNINYTAEQLAMNPTLKGVPIMKAYYDVATGRVERIP
ncbi:MAG TPA: carbonic anhydrase [Thermoanaerobaculia bacterium]|nr:carbonic anhydrase [Thermoanaerobaculia bacterium]